MFPALYVQFHGLLPVFLTTSDITFDSCTMEQKKTSTGQPNLVKLPEELRIRLLHLRQDVLTLRDRFRAEGEIAGINEAIRLATHCLRSLTRETGVGLPSWLRYSLCALSNTMFHSTRQTSKMP